MVIWSISKLGRLVVWRKDSVLVAPDTLSDWKECMVTVTEVIFLAIAFYKQPVMEAEFTDEVFKHRSVW